MASLRPRLKQPYTPATAADLDELSRITAADIVHAGGVWERDAPPAFRTLLDARAETPTPAPRPGRPDSSLPPTTPPTT